MGGEGEGSWFVRWLSGEVGSALFWECELVGEFGYARLHEETSMIVVRVGVC